MTERPRFTLQITATATDIDELGHVSNQVYLRWVNEVAMAHSIALGYGHPDYVALGGVFIVRRHELDYLAPVQQGQTLEATTWVESWRQASCIRATEIKRGDQVVLRGATTWAFVSLAPDQLGRPQRIPQALRAKFV